jgi:two-component system, cell cycle sensor histidine kinase and response regulator CckA
MLKRINPDVKVILSSGYGLQGEVQKVMESGCWDFIQKPYVFTELSQMVHRVLTGREDGDN